MKERIEANLNFRVFNYDIDAGGHVNNIVYIRWLEDLRTKILDDYLPLENLIANGLFPVLRETNIEYRLQVSLKDKVTGRMWMEEYERDMIWKFRAEFEVNGKIAARAFQKGIIFNQKENKIARLNKDFKWYFRPGDQQ